MVFASEVEILIHILQGHGFLSDRILWWSLS